MSSVITERHIAHPLKFKAFFRWCENFQARAICENQFRHAKFTPYSARAPLFDSQSSPSRAAVETRFLRAKRSVPPRGKKKADPKARP